MSWSNPTTPNLPDYTLFVQNVMGVSVVYLPATSPFLGYAFDRALNLVLQVAAGGFDYTWAVYNCAGHIQIAITPDQVVSGVGYTYFQDMRKSLDILLPSFGVVSSSSDESTSTTLATPDALRNLTIEDLGFMRTPWGRTYLSYAQDYGPTIWGLS